MYNHSSAICSSHDVRKGTRTPINNFSSVQLASLPKRFHADFTGVTLIFGRAFLSLATHGYGAGLVHTNHGTANVLFCFDLGTLSFDLKGLTQSAICISYGLQDYFDLQLTQIVHNFDDKSTQIECSNVRLYIVVITYDRSMESQCIKGLL